MEIVDQPEGSLPLPTLWAREKIRDLEEGGEGALDMGSRQVERKTQWIQEAIIGLSKQYSLLSTPTSFVAVEEREEKDKVTGETVLRKVPALVTVGWRGRDRLLPQAGVRPGFDVCLSQVLEPAYELRRELAPANRLRGTAERGEALVHKYSKTDFLMEILSLQRVDGGFDASKEIVECLGLELKTIRKLASTLELQTSGDRLRVLFAAILLEVLEVHFQAEKATWEAVVEKSNAWLDRIIHEAKPKVEGKDLLLWVKEFVDGRVAMERSIG